MAKDAPEFSNLPVYLEQGSPALGPVLMGVGFLVLFGSLISLFTDFSVGGIAGFLVGGSLYVIGFMDRPRTATLTDKAVFDTDSGSLTKRHNDTRQENYSAFKGVAVTRQKDGEGGEKFRVEMIHPDSRRNIALYAGGEQEAQNVCNSAAERFGLAVLTDAPSGQYYRSAKERDLPLREFARKHAYETSFEFLSDRPGQILCSRAGDKLQLTIGPRGRFFKNLVFHMTSLVPVGAAIGLPVGIVLGGPGLDSALGGAGIGAGIGAVPFVLFECPYLFRIVKRRIDVTGDSVVYFCCSPIGEFGRKKRRLDEVMSVEIRDDHVLIDDRNSRLSIWGLDDEAAPWLGKLVESVIVKGRVPDL
jgi:hypothetical protein